MEHISVGMMAAKAYYHALHWDWTIRFHRNKTTGCEKTYKCYLRQNNYRNISTIPLRCFDS
jgi:hypothetical protein